MSVHIQNRQTLFPKCFPAVSGRICRLKHVDTGMHCLLLIALSTWFRDGTLAGCCGVPSEIESWLAAAVLVFCCLVIFMSPLPSLGVALRKGLSGGSQTAVSSGVAVNLSEVRPVQMNQASPFFPSEYMYLEATCAYQHFCVYEFSLFTAPWPRLLLVPWAVLRLHCRSGVQWQDPSRKKV